MQNVLWEKIHIFQTAAAADLLPLTDRRCTGNWFWHLTSGKSCCKICSSVLSDTHSGWEVRYKRREKERETRNVTEEILSDCSVWKIAAASQKLLCCSSGFRFKTAYKCVTICYTYRILPSCTLFLVRHMLTKAASVKFAELFVIQFNLFCNTPSKSLLGLFIYYLNKKYISLFVCIALWMHICRCKSASYSYSIWSTNRKITVEHLKQVLLCQTFWLCVPDDNL